MQPNRRFKPGHGGFSSRPSGGTVIQGTAQIEEPQLTQQEQALLDVLMAELRQKMPGVSEIDLRQATIRSILDRRRTAPAGQADTGNQTSLPEPAPTPAPLPAPTAGNNLPAPVSTGGNTLATTQPVDANVQTLIDQNRQLLSELEATKQKQRRAQILLGVVAAGVAVNYMYDWYNKRQQSKINESLKGGSKSRSVAPEEQDDEEMGEED